MEIPEICMGVGSLQKGKTYKVIQMTIDGVSEMYFADDRTTYSHSVIIKEVLELLDIPYVKVEVWRGVAPDLRGERYSVSGMGVAIRRKDKKILFFGNSLDYGREISEPDLREIQKQHPDWILELSSSTK